MYSLPGLLCPSALPPKGLCQPDLQSQGKVCPPEFQGGSSTEHLPYLFEHQKLYRFMITLLKTASHHIPSHHPQVLCLQTRPEGVPSLAGSLTNLSKIQMR